MCKRGVVAIGALEVILNPTATFFGRPDGFEAGWRIPFFLEGFGHADISADQVAEVVKRGAVVFEETPLGTENCAAKCGAQGAAKPPTKRGAGCP